MVAGIRRGEPKERWLEFEFTGQAFTFQIKYFSMYLILTSPSRSAVPAGFHSSQT